MNRELEIVKRHNSNTSISIRDTCINNDSFDIVYIDFGLFKKEDKKNLQLTLLNKDNFLNGIEQNINSFSLKVTKENELLLEFEQGVFEINYYGFNLLSAVLLENGSIIINSNIINYSFNKCDKILINNILYSIDTINNNKIKLKNCTLTGSFILYKSESNYTCYFVNDYLLKKGYCQLLKDNILYTEDNKNNNCNNNTNRNKNILSTDDLVKIKLQLESINIFKQNCDLLSVASLINNIRDKIEINYDKCSCSNSK